MFVAVDVDLPEHPKYLRLCRALKTDMAGWYLVRMWRWAMRYAKDGDLSRFDALEIEDACGWGGRHGALIAALISSGFIDDAGTRQIHDWMDENGKWVAKADADRKRKAEARMRGRAGTSDGSPQDVRRKSAGRPRDGAGTSPLPTSPLPALPDSGVGAEPAGPAAAQPTYELSFPVDGGAEKSAQLTVAEVLAFQGAFPALDVEAEFKKAQLWLTNNPAKRKTARGLKRFLQSWLERAQNNGGGARAVASVGSERTRQNLEVSRQWLERNGGT